MGMEHKNAQLQLTWLPTHYTGHDQTSIICSDSNQHSSASYVVTPQVYKCYNFVPNNISKLVPSEQIQAASMHVRDSV